VSLFSYVVRCAFEAPEPMESFLSWLVRRHVGDVCAAGADDAEIVRLDPTDAMPYAIEIRYHFASREAFTRYEQEQAPRLRAEGLAEAARLLLSPGKGITMTRTTGESVHRLGRSPRRTVD
jgi:hypothetical protein